MTLKANQKTLYHQAQQLHEQGQWLDRVEEQDNTHGRQIHRRVSVYPAPPEAQGQWAGLKVVLWVERWGVREGKAYSEQMS